MKLIIFDIDGTIVNSVKTDDKCFIETFMTLYQIDLSNVNWNDFENVTDTGLTNEILAKWLNREPRKEELEITTNHFKGLLEKRINEITEIESALSFIGVVAHHANLEIGFATGGWKKTAELKCNSIGLNLNDFIFKSSDDHYNRAKIIELVINDALGKNNISEYEQIVYFGDGLWDLKTTIELGIDFVGVDFERNNKLVRAGVDKVIDDYAEPSKILNWLNVESN